MITHCKVRQPCRGFYNKPLDTYLPWLSLWLALLQWQQLPGFNRAVMLLCQCENFFWIYIAYHNQDSIIGRVPMVIPLLCVMNAHILQIVHPSYYRAAIWMRFIGCRHHFFMH